MSNEDEVLFGEKLELSPNLGDERDQAAAV